MTTLPLQDSSSANAKNFPLHWFTEDQLNGLFLISSRCRCLHLTLSKLGQHKDVYRKNIPTECQRLINLKCETQRVQQAAKSTITNSIQACTFLFCIFLSRGIILWFELPWPENLANSYARHTETQTAVVTLCRWPAKQTIPLSVLARNQTKGFWTWDLAVSGSGNGTRVESRTKELKGGWRGTTRQGQSTPDTGAERRVGKRWGPATVKEDRVKMCRHSSCFVEVSLESTLALVCTCKRCYITLPALELTPSVLVVFCSFVLFFSHSLVCIWCSGKEMCVTPIGATSSWSPAKKGKGSRRLSRYGGPKGERHTVSTLLGLISSVYCDLHYWRSNQRPQIAEIVFVGFSVHGNSIHSIQAAGKYSDWI